MIESSLVAEGMKGGTGGLGRAGFLYLFTDRRRPLRSDASLPTSGVKIRGVWRHFFEFGYMATFVGKARRYGVYVVNSSGVAA